MGAWLSSADAREMTTQLHLRGNSSEVPPTWEAGRNCCLPRILFPTLLTAQSGMRMPSVSNDDQFVFSPSSCLRATV